MSKKIYLACNDQNIITAIYMYIYMYVCMYMYTYVYIFHFYIYTGNESSVCNGRLCFLQILIVT